MTAPGFNGFTGHVDSLLGVADELEALEAIAILVSVGSSHDSDRVGEGVAWVSKLMADRISEMRELVDALRAESPKH